MPDDQGNIKADEEAIPDTSLHAYKEARDEDIRGDSDKLSSDDRDDLKAKQLEDPDEPGPPKKA